MLRWRVELDQGWNNRDNLFQLDIGEPVEQVELDALEHRQVVPSEHFEYHRQVAMRCCDEDRMPAKLLYRDAQGKDAAVDLPQDGAFLGRAVDCVVRTDDAMVSRKNCKLTFLGEVAETKQRLSDAFPKASKLNTDRKTCIMRMAGGRLYAIPHG